MVASLRGLGQVVEELVGLVVVAVEGDGVDGDTVLHLHLGDDGLGWLHTHIRRTFSTIPKVE